MDFTALPPEVNSARLYAGPGAGPLLAAAAAWQRLAIDVDLAAQAYRSVLTDLLSGAWRGPSSTAMAAAAAPYLSWLHATAGQAGHTAAAAHSAAAAYQSAHAAIVPPAQIAANRTRLLALVATNFFGQHSPAIAATEADYDAMWAQDLAVMNGYAAASTAAGTLSPFTTPPATVNPAGAVTAQAVPAIASAQAVAGPAQGLLGAFTGVDAFNDTVSSLSGAASVSSSSFGGASIATTNHAISVNAERDDHQGIGPFLGLGTAPAAAPAPVLARSAPTAVLGRASIAGSLSVPQAWSATVPAATGPVTPTVAGTPAPAMAPTAVSPGMFGEAMLGTLAGRGVNHTAARLRRPSVVPRSPAAG